MNTLLIRCAIFFHIAIATKMTSWMRAIRKKYPMTNTRWIRWSFDGCNLIHDHDVYSDLTQITGYFRFGRVRLTIVIGKRNRWIGERWNLTRLFSTHFVPWTFTVTPIFHGRTLFSSSNRAFLNILITPISVLIN